MPSTHLLKSKEGKKIAITETAIANIKFMRLRLISNCVTNFGKSLIKFSEISLAKLVSLYLCNYGLGGLNSRAEVFAVKPHTCKTHSSILLLFFVIEIEIKQSEQDVEIYREYQ